MHFLILTLFVVAVWFLLTRYSQEQPKASGHRSVTEDRTQPMAYLSKGKLFFRSHHSEFKEVHSPYIDETLKKAEKSKSLHGWKEGTAWGQNFVGKQTVETNDTQAIKFSSVQRLPDSKLLYFLKDNFFGGLFEYDINTGQELRHIHKQNLDYQDMQFSETRNQIICSNHYSNGIANILIADRDGSSHREITGGDTVDSHPAWVNDKESLIVYQSQGQARSEAGYVIAHGPASILLLNYESGELETVLEDENFDFLSPQVNSQGDLLYIKRPYETISYNTTSAFTDTVFLPFRLLRAVFHYLNFFSLMYSKKPLTSASGPEVKTELKDIMLQGKRIDAEKALQQRDLTQGVPSLVPESWQLIKRDRYGKEEVLATNVASFSVDDGIVLFSNGCGVFALENKELVLMHQDKLIESAIRLD